LPSHGTNIVAASFVVNVKFKFYLVGHLKDSYAFFIGFLNNFLTKSIT
jgi:hypothetical protein